MNDRLAKCVRDIARQQTDHEASENDVNELLLVLARALEGKDIIRAFGAPGDWGYGTPIGDALAGK